MRELFLLFIIISGIIKVFGTSFLEDEIIIEKKEDKITDKDKKIKKTEDTITDSTLIFGFSVGIGIVIYFNCIRKK